MLAVSYSALLQPRVSKPALASTQAGLQESVVDANKTVKQKLVKVKFSTGLNTNKSARKLSGCK